MLSETRYEHIILNDAHVPMIAGTTLKVVELVLDHLAYGWSPEELHFQHPYLTMGRSTLPWRTTGIIKQNWTRRLNGGFNPLIKCSRPYSLLGW